jgi:hypothetical protein
MVCYHALYSSEVLLFMQGEKKERWMELCAQAAVEQDPAKLMELVREINNLLEEKERRLGITPPVELGPPGITSPKTSQ